MAAFSGILTATFMDRFDRRKALATAMFGLVCVTAGVGLAFNLPTFLIGTAAFQARDIKS